MAEIAKTHVDKVLEGGMAVVLLVLLAALAYAIGRFILLPLVRQRETEHARLWEALEKREEECRQEREAALEQARKDRDAHDQALERREAAYAASLREIRDAGRLDNERLGQALDRLAKAVDMAETKRATDVIGLVTRLERLEGAVGGLVPARPGSPRPRPRPPEASETT